MVLIKLLTVRCLRQGGTRLQKKYLFKETFYIILRIRNNEKIKKIPT